MQVVAQVSPEELRLLLPLPREERLLDIQVDVDAVGDALQLSPITLSALLTSWNFYPAVLEAH